MPRTKLQDDALLDALAHVFRKHGYEGASLSRIATATGLQRASLYHRFPGGKEEMALAVLQHSGQRFAREVLEPLAAGGTPVARLRLAAKGLASFYADCDESCVIEALSFEDVPALRAAVHALLDGVIEAFAKIGRQAGLTPATARRRAEETLVRIQGSLVVRRATGDGKPLARVLQELPELLAREKA